MNEYPQFLKEKVAIVTGSSRGMGKGMATALAGAGATVIITGRHLQEARETAQEISAAGTVAIAEYLDVLEPASIEQLVKAVISSYGRIDILVNNAGSIVRKPFLEVTLAEWETVVNTILRGSFLCAQAVARTMVKRGIHGKIINIGSETCRLAIPNICSYVAARGGIAQLTRALSLDLAPHGICVNCLAPGYFRTKQTQALFDDPDWEQWLKKRTPLGRGGRPESDLNGAILFLASPGSDYVTGQLLFVDGGMNAALG